MTPARPFVVHEYVRWSDVDPMGIIRYDAYTRFFELAESELFRAVGVPHSALQERFRVSIPRRVMHMEFVSPPVLDERLEVRTYVSGVGRTSLTMNFDIHGNGGQVRCTGYLVLVCVQSDGGRIVGRAWPPELLALLAPFRVTTEQARAGAASSPNAS